MGIELCERFWCLASFVKWIDCCKLCRLNCPETGKISEISNISTHQILQWPSYSRAKQTRFNCVAARLAFSLVNLLESNSDGAIQKIDDRSLSIFEQECKCDEFEGSSQRNNRHGIHIGSGKNCFEKFSFERNILIIIIYIKYQESSLKRLNTRPKNKTLDELEKSFPEVCYFYSYIF